MDRRAYLLVSLLAGLALAVPPVLFLLATGPAETELARGLLRVALAAGLSWLPLWPAAAAAHRVGYWAGLPVALACGCLYGVAVTYLLPVTAAQAAVTWLTLWWPALQAPGNGGRLGTWALLLVGGGLVWWRAPAAWDGLWAWVLAFNGLLALLYTFLPAAHGDQAHRSRGLGL